MKKELFIGTLVVFIAVMFAVGTAHGKWTDFLKSKESVQSETIQQLPTNVAPPPPPPSPTSGTGSCEMVWIDNRSYWQVYDGTNPEPTNYKIWECDGHNLMRNFCENNQMKQEFAQSCISDFKPDQDCYDTINSAVCMGKQCQNESECTTMCGPQYKLLEARCGIVAWDTSGEYGSRCDSVIRGCRTQYDLQNYPACAHCLQQTDPENPRNPGGADESNYELQSPTK